MLAAKRKEAELLFRRIGVTLAAYSEGGDPERLIPFDIIPRILGADEWRFLARGLTQRVLALNAFLDDVDPADGICPGETHFRVCIGLDHQDAAPVRGLRRGQAAEELTAEVRVQQAGDEQ